MFTPELSVFTICFYHLTKGLVNLAHGIGSIARPAVEFESRRTDPEGIVIVSAVLGLPTVGPILLQALLGEDMFLAGTIILFLGLLTVVGTLLSDLLLVLVDPRIRLEE